MNFRIWTIRNLTVVGTAEHDAGCRRWMATCEPGPVSLPSLSLPVEQLLVLSIQNACPLRLVSWLVFMVM